MLRITHIDTEEFDTLKLEGSIAGAPVGEVQRVADACLTRSGRVGLDLSGVTFIDAAGASLLRELLRRGVEIRKSSGFVSELLREVES